mmetsp:Transcript_122543/g.183252  ORF Transcript_122543/g.183252 Transcript_122543/m.183252 type:complete len:82 (-) Transcript_122543:1435-1680(-)
MRYSRAGGGDRNHYYDDDKNGPFLHDTAHVRVIGVQHVASLDEKGNYSGHEIGTLDRDSAQNARGLTVVRWSSGARCVGPC